MTEPFKGSAEAYARARPDDIVFFEGARTVTWAQWNAEAGRLAEGLARLGIGAGDRIAVRMAIRYEWFVVQLAASKLGAALVGINDRSRAGEASHMLQDSGAKGLILDDPEPEEIVAAATAAGITTIVSLEPAGPAVARYGDHLAAETGAVDRTSLSPAQLILYTSGTTGKPKGVALDPALLASRPTLQAYREVMAGTVPVSEQSRFLLCLPMHHGAGPSSALFVLRAGGSVVIQRKFDAEVSLRLIQDLQVTNWMAVPTMILRLQALPETVLGRYDRTSMQVVNIGAAAVPASLKAWAMTFFGPQCLIFEGYGMSETQMISYMLPEHWAEAPDSSGKPLPYVEVRIQGPDGQAVPHGATGEICVKTPLTIDRYLNRPPLGPEDITADGFFRTGDLGRLDERGYLYVTDRLKDMVIVGGANVYPAEVEAVLNAHPDVREAAVIGTPHPDLGEQVTAICEMAPGAPRDVPGLLAYCRESLSGIKVPRLIMFVDELPRTPTGKVTKNRLREPFWHGRERKV